MNRIVFVCFALLFSVLAAAQDFQVYTVKGDILVQKDGKQEKVAPGMKLTAGSVLTVPAQARLVVLDESKKELYTVKTAATGELGKLVKTEGTSTQQLTDSYMAFIKQKIMDSGNPKDRNYKQSAGTSYRETDSLMLNILVPAEIPDSVRTETVEKTE